ncbi:MAG: sulfatase-like hydrolase/transferase [Victivallales bacterium]|nr:sulfatase-like hydrolase/transferase [Victivallales bacterium]
MRKPNLLFIMTDQQKATSLDLYNSQVNFIKTSALRELAREGTVFNASYCPYPLCVPSRISMLTGMHPSFSGYVANTPFIEDRHDTIFQAAKKRGYRTMLVGKDHAYCEASIGGDNGHHPKFMDNIFDKMYCALHNGYQPPEIERDLPHVRPWLNQTDVLHRIWGSEIAPWNSDQSVTARLCQVAEEYIQEWDRVDRKTDTPFCMWLSFPDPHEYYQAPKDVVECIDPATIQLPPNWESDIGGRAEYIQFMHWYFNSGGVPQEEVKKLIRVYLAMCMNVDIWLGKLFSFLKKNGIWEETLIVFTSDHGDFNGEHQLIQKFNCGYDGCCRVPLIMAWPGRSVQGRVYEHPVSLVDIPSTICDILGWERLREDQGNSMKDVLFDETPSEREFTVYESGVAGESLTKKDIPNFPGHRFDVEPIGRWSYDPPHRFGGKMYAVRTKDYKLIVRQDQANEFYDMKTDPWETRNVYNDTSYTAQIIKHFSHLSEYLVKVSQKRAGSSIAPQDEWYRAGGNLQWEQSLPEKFANANKK